jgi:hypothetical protein
MDIGFQQNIFGGLARTSGMEATQTDKLHKYADTKIERHVMVKMGKSFYDGDEVYWAKRLSKGYGDISPSKAKLLKKQNGKCA